MNSDPWAPVIGVIRPGDVITSIGMNALVWQTNSDEIGDVSNIPSAQIQSGEWAFVVSIDNRYVFVLFNSSLGYILHTSKLARIF